VIDLHKLQHFVTLAEEKSYSKAAARLNLSQPALSRSIQALERQVGAVLFNRSRLGITLTAVGASLREEAERLLFQAETLEQNLAHVLDGTRGEVRFGIGPASASAFLPHLLQALHEAYPDVRVHIMIGSALEMHAQLLAGDLDFFVARNRALPTIDARVSAKPVTRASPVFYVRARHPLLELREITIEDIAQFRIASGTAWNDNLTEAGTGELARLVASLELDNYELLAELASTTDTVLISSFATPHPSLVQLPIRAEDLGVPSSQVSIFLVGGRIPSPVSQLVQSVLYDQYARHSEGQGTEGLQAGLRTDDGGTVGNGQGSRAVEGGV